MPEECSLQLKDIVIGDEVFTTPTKSNPMLAGQKTREAATKHPNSQMLAGPSYSSPTGAARSSSKIVERDPGGIFTLKGNCKIPNFKHLRYFKIVSGASPTLWFGLNIYICPTKCLCSCLLMCVSAFLRLKATIL